MPKTAMSNCISWHLYKSIYVIKANKILIKIVGKI